MGLLKKATWEKEQRASASARQAVARSRRNVTSHRKKTGMRIQPASSDAEGGMVPKYAA